MTHGRFLFLKTALSLSRHEICTQADMSSSSNAVGIDVSHHKGVVTWAEVKSAGILFAFAKATEGISFVDSEFYRNWFNMRQHGVFRGAYHFYRPLLDPVSQANHFISIARAISHPFDMPPVLDVENSPAYVREEFQKFSAAENARRVRTWLNAVEAAFGKTPIIYTNQDTWRTSLGDDPSFARYPLWIANYGVSAPNLPSGNWSGRGWHFWQRTDKAVVPGVNRGTASVDLNVFRGKESDFQEWMGWGSLPELQRPQIRNSQMFAAFRLVAQQQGLKLFDLLTAAGLGYLADPNLGDYTYGGVVVRELAVTEVVRESIQSAIDIILAEGGTIQENPIYLLTNQQIINAVYRAAARLGIGGWQLLTQVGLTDLVGQRSRMYTGLTIEYLPGLTMAQREILSTELGFNNGYPGEPSGEGVYPGVSNQMVINAIYRLANSIGKSGWELLTRARLDLLVERRSEPYTGPLIGQIENLSASDRRFVAGVLGVQQEVGSEDPTYPGVSNQDVINAIYSVGKQTGTAGWTILERSQLTMLAVSAAVRSAFYQGPRVENLISLSSRERTLLRALLNV